jgi:hypothetical protein
MSCPIRVRIAEAYLVVGEGVCLRHDGGGVWRLPGVVERLRWCSGRGRRQVMMMMELGVEVQGPSSSEHRLAIALLLARDYVRSAKVMG